MKNKYEKVNITIGYANSLKAKEKKYLVSDQMPGLCLKVEPLSTFSHSRISKTPMVVILLAFFFVFNLQCSNNVHLM